MYECGLTPVEAILHGVDLYLKYCMRHQTGFPLLVQYPLMPSGKGVKFVQYPLMPCFDR